MMDQHTFFKCNKINIHLIILKSRYKLDSGRETKTVSTNGIRSWNTTFNPCLTFRVLSQLFSFVSLSLFSLSCYLVSLQCCIYFLPGKLSLKLLIFCCYSFSLQSCLTL